MGNVPISSQYIESVLIHMIWKDYCEESSADFIYNSQNVVNDGWFINCHSVARSLAPVQDFVDECVVFIVLVCFGVIEIELARKTSWSLLWTFLFGL
jgi:hypothetical protein